MSKKTKLTVTEEVTNAKDELTNRQNDENKNPKKVHKDLVLKEILITDLKVGDEIHLTPKSCAACAYTVLDIGNPFILLEDTAHFATLYRVTKPLYIEDK